MKKLLSILILSIILIIFSISNSYAVVKPTTEFYVNDYANILNDETEKYIKENSIVLHDGTTAQIVVVTIPSLEGRAIEEYATDLFRSFGIGDKEKNNGLLILLALQERQCRIEVGYGLEGILPDGKTGRIQDEYMIPYFKENNFNEGMLNGYKAFYKEVAEEYNFDTEVTPIKPEVEEDFFSTAGGMLLSLKSMLVFLFFFIDFSSKKTKIKVFIFLEIFTIIITILSFTSGAGPAALLLLVFGTVINLLAVLACFGGFGGRGGGGFYYGGHSSGGGFSSGGGGYHGGGGSSGGGGSTRSF